MQCAGPDGGVPSVGRGDLIRMLLSATWPGDILDVVAHAVCETTAFRRSLILDVDRARKSVRARAGHGLDVELIRSAGGRLDDYPVFSRLAHGDAPLVVAAADLADLMPARCVATFDVRSTVVVQPLRTAQLGLLGVIFCDTGADACHPDDGSLATLRDLSEVAALAFQHAVLLTQLVAFQALRERSRIAGELHDGVSQLLFAAVLDVDELRAGHRLGLTEVSVLDRLADRLESALQQLRAALIELVSGDVPDGRSEGSRANPVAERVRSVVQEFEHSGGIAPEFEAVGEGPEPVPARCDVLVRTVREGLTNVIKHAGATRAVVRLRRGESWWTVEVSDDGHGSPGEMRRALAGRDARAFGLQSLAAETARLGGRLWVSEAPGLRGVRVGVAVPVSTDE